MTSRLLLIPIAILSCAITHAADFFVSPQGDDANAGTVDQPWRTIQKAADTLAPGDTVFVRDGVYNEAVNINVSGSRAGGFVTFANFPNEHPIVDGSALTPPDDASALFFLNHRSFVAIVGFEIRNYKATEGSKVPAGIFVTGASHDIQIRSNNVHDIEYDTADGNAFGVAIYGTNRTPISNVVLDGNEVHHLKTGNSESVTLNGNVTTFQVTNNRVHDNNNIGIDFIGFEKTCLDARQDQARDGVCRGNIVTNISSAANPAYQGETSATGIYCDGAARVIIERNIISFCDYGSELTSEHKGRTASYCTFRDNFVFWCLHPGLSLGGYDSGHTGGAFRCTITNNTFFQNNTSDEGDGEIMLQFRVLNCSIKSNILVTGAPGLFIANGTSARNNSGNVLDYNLYFSPLGFDGSAWIWKDTQIAGFAAWKIASRQDAHSLFADPNFVSSSTPDLHLQAGSPAIDAGNPRVKPALGEMDIDGEVRLKGAAMDVGADEL